MDDSEVLMSENASEALLQFGNDSVFWVVVEASTTYPTGAGVTMSDDVGATVFGGTNTSGVVVNVVKRSGGGSVFESDLIIPLYVVIFLLSVVGNSLVLITLAQNKRMRTVTNVYLLNLAVSDLLLGVFCMPFTLVGQVLRNFIFGAAMCKLIPYFQAVSVSVGVWTLVAISLERYFAICRPLKSRRWQTQFHAYKMIGFVWVASLLWNTPILAVSRLQAMREKGRHKCREEWPSKASERAFNIFLDAMLLLVPLVIMTLAYSLIVSKLWKGLRREIRHHSSCRRQQLERTASSGTVNEVALSTNNLNGNSTTGTAVVTPLRQHRLVPAASKLTTKCEPTRDTSTRRGAKSVKLWLIKGMVQVRLPSAMGGGTSRRPGNLQPGGKTVTIAPLPQVSSGAGQYASAGTPPETSRLVIGTSSNSNGATPCNDIDLNAKLDHLQAGEPISPALPGDSVASPHTTYTFTRHAIRSNYMDKSIEAKKKVIRMLFVVVAEFFVCWAPLHVLNTWYTFSPEAVYDYVGSTGISLVQLLAYISSCCNPITYCFMNRKFRQAFLGIFDCYRCWGLYCCCCCGVRGSRRESRMGVLQRDGAVLGGMGINNSDASGNDSTMFAGRASTGARSADFAREVMTGSFVPEVVVLEAEDRV